MISRNRRHLTVLTMTSSMLAMVALAACSPSTPSKDAGGAGDSKDVTLSVWSWRTEDVAAYNEIFAVYEKAHPGTKVDFKSFKNTEYNLILTTGLAGAKGPDVAQVRSYGQLQPTIASKSLLPLDDVVDLSSWDANVVKSAVGKDDGKLYSVPLAQQTLQMFYNKDIFAKYNLTPPTTWAQFTAINATLKKAGVIPMAVGAKDSWTLPMLHQVLAAPLFGGSAFEKAVTTGEKTFADPDWVKSVDVVNTLKSDMPDSAVGVAYTDAQILFTSGKAAMFPGGSFELGFFQKQSPDLKMGVFEVPAPEGSASMKPTTTGWADGAFGISAKSDAQAASKDLVKWMATKEFGQLVADKIQQLSAVPGVSYSDPLLKQMADNYTKNPTPYLLLTDFRYGTPSGTDLMGTGVQEMLLGKKDAAAISADLQTGVSQWFKPTN